MYNDSQLTITTHIPLSDQGGRGLVSSETFYPPTDSEPLAVKTKRFRRGDVNPSDGTVFWAYDHTGKERWMSPQKYMEARQRHYQAGKKYENTVDRQKRNAHVKIWSQSERGKALTAARYNRPEVRAKRREQDRLRRIKYNQRPEVIAAKEAAKEAHHRQQEEARRLRATPEYQAELRKRGNQYIKRRYAKDPQFALAYKVRARVYQAIQKGGASKTGRTEELIGCSFDFLRQHIERQFKGKMSWDNPGSFHIDHIIPLAAFDLTDPAQLKVACNWQNMRPLTPRKNMSKGAKLLHPQQQLPLSVHSTIFNTQAA
jgi:hypothetical protein